MLLQIIVFLGIFSQVSAISCHVCTYMSTSSDNSLLHSILSSANVGSADCWNTPSAPVTQCSSGVTSCLSSKLDSTLEMSYIGQSFQYTMKYIVKTCGGSSTSDTCQSLSVNDYLVQSGLTSSYAAAGITYTATGDATDCSCSTDGCNYGNTLKYSLPMLLFSIFTALKMRG